MAINPIKESKRTLPTTYRKLFIKNFINNVTYKPLIFLEFQQLFIITITKRYNTFTKLRKETFIGLEPKYTCKYLYTNINVNIILLLLKIFKLLY